MLPKTDDKIDDKTATTNTEDPTLRAIKNEKVMVVFWELSQIYGE